MTLWVVVFLMAHGLLHLAVWVPQPAPPHGEEPPFEPDHSAVLTRVLPETRTHALSVVLASAAAVAYVLAGIAVAVDLLVVPSVVVAAAVGLALKGLYFHPWLTIGVLIDLAVLSAALTGWPVPL